MLTSALVLAGLVGLAGCTPEPPERAVPTPSASPPAESATAWDAPAPVVEDGVEVTRGIVYREVEGQRLALDAYRPPGGERLPVLVMVHGGAFVAGDRARERFARFGPAFARAGWLAVSIDYRLAPRWTYPAPVEDVTAAVDWVRAPGAVGHLGADPERVALFGSSAGGTLAALAALRPAGTADRVDAVVSLSGVLDFADTRLGELEGGSLPSLGRSFLDCPEAATAAECPAAAEASAVGAVGPDSPPFYLLTGDREAIPDSQARGMDAALRRAGVDSVLRVLPSGEHATDLVDDAVLAEIIGFLAARS